jgi:hypothetical protein
VQTIIAASPLPAQNSHQIQTRILSAPQERIPQQN